ncbi:hypothetical protein Ssi03_03970 [Sphaerisporangium siamense]|uniref:Uncharacterized protein n=1 Tax=Sphaerisporangium siamense TaxID=795645 RepID=A0A7W7DCA2_9ACTN|nr:hypothetical protein [Sphaerisporangium siamense]MBB4703936.1 hypothetical protein [Sphaerisporangium siamense]GII82407.1 hypothetical protein Ssi03_03970 [Sphaerisporangium siamense]
MGGLLETATGLVDQRLLRTTWAPVLAFAGALLALAATGAGWARSWAWWGGLPADVRALSVAALAAVTILLAQILASARARLMRLYEGYWEGLPFGAALAGRGRARHARLQGERRGAADYPLSPARVMPTRVGNILRAAEEHARRYGIDAVTAWPRLYVVLPESFVQAFTAAAVNVETMVAISVLGAAFALAGGVLALALLPWYAVALCVWTGAAVAWLGYRGLARTALPYAELIRTAFDVHRWRLLEAMGLERPCDFEAELRQWGLLDKLWRRGAIDSGTSLHMGYPQPSTPAEDPARPHPAHQDPPPARQASSRPPAPAGVAGESPLAHPVRHGDGPDPQGPSGPPAPTGVAGEPQLAHPARRDDPSDVRDPARRHVAAGVTEQTRPVRRVRREDVPDARGLSGAPPVPVTPPAVPASGEPPVETAARAVPVEGGTPPGPSLEPSPAGSGDGAVRGASVTGTVTVAGTDRARGGVRGWWRAASVPVVAGSVVAATGVVAAVLALARPDASEPAATRTLPAYHVLTAADLAPADAALTGRYTLRPLKDREAADPEALGPRLPAGALTGRAVTTLSAQPGAGALFARGSRVALVATPGKGAQVTARDVLVLDHGPGDRLVVAILPADLARLLAARAAIWAWSAPA